MRKSAPPIVAQQLVVDRIYAIRDDLDYAALCGIENGPAHRAAIFYDRFPVRAEDPLALDVRYPRA